MTLEKILLSGLLMLLVCGCQRNRPEPTTMSYKTVAADPGRDTEVARRCNALAVALLEQGDLAGAERELKVSLGADALFGPAHNNLGTVYYRQKKFYLAAWEFQYAAKLMPDRSSPPNNLALVYETVGKLDEAAKFYEKAMKLDPNVVEITVNLARVCVRSGRKDERTRQLLQEIILRDARPDWAAWARETLALMGHPPTSATRPSAESQPTSSPSSGPVHE